MRAYYWGNYYLSPIQQGIQALHTTGEMFVKYQPDPNGDTAVESEVNRKQGMLYDWAANHKTVVILNAGDHDDLQEIAKDFDHEDNKYPWATFVEEGIGHTLTCVGIIVDDHIIDAVQEVRTARRERRRFQFKQHLEQFEYNLVMLMANTNMAR